jgi:hypothetical protein
MKILLVLLVLSVSTFVFAEGYSIENAVCQKHLFQIGKSDNKNVLYYDAVVKDGEFDPKKPVDIYWVMYAEKNQREGLTFLERPHFDISVREISKGKEYIINVKDKQLAPKDIRVFFDTKDCPRATAILNGTLALLDNIFIQIDGGIVVPNVVHLDLTGYALSDGSKVMERVLPN